MLWLFHGNGYYEALNNNILFVSDTPTNIAILLLN